MKDGIMNVWEVVDNSDDKCYTLFICARQCVAEYLRDWCEAESINISINSFLYLKSQEQFAHLTENMSIEKIQSEHSSFHVYEGEVIL